jgi:hypothetical protein
MVWEHDGAAGRQVLEGSCAGHKATSPGQEVPMEVGEGC